MESDPVFEHDSVWYFWGEDWATQYGPYDTEELARIAFKEYVSWLEGAGSL